MNDGVGRLMAGGKTALLSLLSCMLAVLIGFDTILDRILPRWLGVWDYSHGYLVLGMAAWALFERVREEGSVSLRPSWSGWVVLTGLVLVYALLQQIDFTLGMNLTLLAVIGAALWTCGGIRLLRMGLLPLLLLAYAIPFWDRLGQPLQDIATVAVKEMLSASGIPTLAEGNTLRTARAAVEVAAACSGLTFLLAALTLSTFYTAAWLRTLWPGLLLIALSVVVAITSNWVRIYLIVLAGHFSDMQHYLIVEDHEFFGWALFSVFMVGLIAFARWLEIRFHSGAARQVASTEPGQGEPIIPTRSRVTVTILAIVVLALPVLIRPDAAPDRAPESLTLAGTTPIDERASGRLGWHPTALNPAAELRATVDLGQTQGYLYLARYPEQQPNGKVTATGHDLEARWSRQQSRIARYGDLEVEELELLRGDRKRLVWSWYRVGGSNAARLTQAKMLEVMGILKGDPTGALVIVSAECGASCDTQRAILERFLKSRAADLHLLADKG
jgi:EpsI family protein